MKNIIDYLTIKSTINELAKTENVTLVDKLLDILNNNKIAKSEKHNKKEDIKTNHYKIDLSKNQLNDIIDLLMDLPLDSLQQFESPWLLELLTVSNSPIKLASKLRIKNSHQSSKT